MADLGNSSQADTAHAHRTSSWVTVGLITVAAIVLGFAFVLKSIPVAVIGIVLLVVGVVMGVVTGIMDDAY
jgi:hypothetical protein